jgi:hypothetical protein
MAGHSEVREVRTQLCCELLCSNSDGQTRVLVRVVSNFLEPLVVGLTPAER